MDHKTFTSPFTESQVDGTQPQNQYHYIIYPLVTGYKWARYLSDGSTKLQFVDHVYDTSSSAYPNGGVKNGYYYERVATQDNLIPDKKNDPNDDGRVGYTTRSTEISIPTETRYNQQTQTTSDNGTLSAISPIAGVYCSKTSAFYYISGMTAYFRGIRSNTSVKLASFSSSIQSTNLPSAWMGLVTQDETNQQCLVVVWYDAYIASGSSDPGNRRYKIYIYNIASGTMLHHNTFLVPENFWYDSYHGASVIISPQLVFISRTHFCIIDKYYIISGVIGTNTSSYIKNPIFVNGYTWEYEPIPSTQTHFAYIATQMQSAANDPYTTSRPTSNRYLCMIEKQGLSLKRYLITPSNYSLYSGGLWKISEDNTHWDVWWPSLRPFIADAYKLDDTITIEHYRLSEEQLSSYGETIDIGIDRDLILSECQKTDIYDRTTYTRLSYSSPIMGNSTHYYQSKPVLSVNNNDVYFMYTFGRLEPYTAGTAYSAILFRLVGLNLIDNKLQKTQESITPQSVRSAPFNYINRTYYDINYANDFGYDQNISYGIGQYANYSYWWRRYTSTVQVPYTVTLGTNQEMYYKTNPNNSLDIYTGSKPSQICYVRADQYNETQEKKHMSH